MSNLEYRLEQLEQSAEQNEHDLVQLRIAEALEQIRDYQEQQTIAAIKLIGAINALKDALQNHWNLE